MNLNDIVRIGKGKVEYKVTNLHPEQFGQVLIESLNTEKSQLIDTDRLTVIRSADLVPPTPGQETTIETIGTGVHELVATPETESVTDNPQRAPFGLSVLATMSQNAKQHVYAGTVPEHVKAGRRAKNKVARRSRRANR